MLNCLTVNTTGLVPPSNAAPANSRFWINGKDLLTIAQYAMDGLATVGWMPSGDGSYNYPWVLTGEARAWLAMAKALAGYQGQERYFWICGRFVKKVGGYYMVDAGGDQGGPAWDQMPRWDRNSRSWVGFQFERGGPSYRNLAKYMELIQQDSSKALSEETWSQHKAEKMRKVLSADPDSVAKYGSKGNWTSGQVLPVLAATLFLAEPARNIRAFLANRILLDLMEAGATYGGRKVGSAPKAYTWNKALLGDSSNQLKGGKSSAANAGSARAAAPIAPDATDVGTGAYSQAKELTLLCRYLTWSESFHGTDEGSVDKRAYTQLVLAGDPALNPDLDLSTPDKIFGHFKWLIQFAVKTWSL